MATRMWQRKKVPCFVLLSTNLLVWQRLFCIRFSAIFQAQTIQMILDHAVPVVGYGSECGGEGHWTIKIHGVLIGELSDIPIWRNSNSKYDVYAFNAMASCPTEEFPSSSTTSSSTSIRDMLLSS